LSSIADFDYELPPERIAQQPLPERDRSRLLLLDRRSGELEHRSIQDLPALLDPGDLLVVNRSRVFPARLLGSRPAGGKAEILLLRPVGEDAWEAFVRPGRRLRAGDVVTIDDDLSVRVDSEGLPPDARRRVRLSSRAGNVKAALERSGHMPLPPYIHREDTAADRERYQTVYAREPGSVAAPTAGLHFTVELLERLAAQGISRAEVVLHVGPGTFKPVAVEDISQHTVEPEPFAVPAETAAAVSETRGRGGRIVAVGTTSVRVLESAADAEGRLQSREGQTSLVIVPGYTFRAVDALLTNFHLPRSSLLLLVCAFAGRERVLGAYAEAVRLGYRFYSYGDAMLVR
jgi:S-adenosylmethionine:tRNA ribosyltransferase-isomerase